MNYKNTVILFLLVSMVFSFSNCSNSLSIRTNKPRKEKTIRRNISKYNLDEHPHFLASSEYIKFYNEFINDKIEITPSDFANHCFIFNKDGFLLKETQKMTERKRGCGNDKYDLLRWYNRDSTFSILDTSMVEVDSSFNIYRFIDDKQIISIDSSKKLSYGSYEYIALIHWGVFCHRYNKIARYRKEDIKQHKLPVKTVYLNIDYKINQN